MGNIKLMLAGENMTPANDFKCLRYWLMLAALSPLMCFAQPTDSQAVETRQVTTEINDEETQRPRLKYRKGPVCMCNDGMSEADIQAAERKRLQKAKSD